MHAKHIPFLPHPVQADDSVVYAGLQRPSVQFERGTPAPGRDPNIQRESRLLGPLARIIDRESHGSVERIIRCLPDGYLHTAHHFGRDRGRGIDQSGKTAVGRCVPEILHELGPPLVHVAQTAGVSVQGSEQVVRVVVRRGERPPLFRAGDLVGLLEVLPGGIVVRSLRRKGIVGDALQPVRPADVPADTEHRFQGEHHLHGRAQLAAA